jgi:hypothetical protein
MNRSIIFAMFVFSSFLTPALQQAYSQSPQDKCGTMEYFQKQKDSDPGLEAKMLLLEKQTQEWISHNYKRSDNPVITIPVVVHILWNTKEQNISNQRVIDQIAITNRDLAGLNYHSMGVFSPTLKANTGIQLCLARKRPDGTPTDGIERAYTSVASFSMDNTMKHTSSGGLDGWDPTRYFNIWVCNLFYDDGSGYVYSGYGQYPGSGINATYGAVIRYGAFGPSDSTYYRGNGGCTTHEIGHCLSLYHIWGDDTVSCRGSDACPDTPNQAGRTTGIHTGFLTDACSPSSPGVMYMNFMDYSDDIVYANFTPGQTARIQALFASPYGLLLSLAGSDACMPPTSIETPAVQASPEFFLFPNPAKEQTTVTYTLMEPGTMSWTITNILGIEMAGIKDDQMHAPGTYSIQFDAGNLPRGPSYLTMRTGRFTETRKLLIIR